MPNADEDWDITRRQLVRLGAGGMLALSSSGLLAACGSGAASGGSGSSGGASSPAYSNGPSTKGPPVRGGTLTVGILTGGNAETIDVRKTYVIADYLRTQSLYDSLFFPTPGGEVAPALATEAIPNHDATVWTLKLRDGVEWHDGKPFTADDVVYTIKASWASADNFAVTIFAPFIDYKNVRKRDKLTVEVPLLKPLAQFPYMTNMSNLLIVQDGTKKYAGSPGTGPFKYESFTPGSGSVFTANRNYWISGQPYVDRLVVNSSFSTDSARLNAVLSGTVDVAPTVPQALARAYSSRIVLGNQQGAGAITLGMRLDKAPFTDVRVVQAMKYLVDREAIVKNIYQGYATVGNDCFGNTYQYYASELKRPHDPERARSLLKQAGVLGRQVTLLTSETIPGQNELATLFQAQARAIGLQVRLQTVDPSLYYTPSSPGGAPTTKVFSTDSFLGNISSLPILYVQAFASQYFNSTHWSGAKRQAILFDALAEKDPAKAKDKWLAAQKLQYDFGGYVIAANQNWVDAYASHVRGLQTTTIGPISNYTFRTGWLAA